MWCRRAFRGIAILGVVAALLLWPLPGRMRLGVPRRIWGLIVALYLLGPGLLVYFGPKELRHRARPADSMPFGGRGLQAGLGPGLARARAAGSVAAAGACRGAQIYACAASSPRLAMGRYDLSDVVAAALFMAAI